MPQRNENDQSVSSMVGSEFQATASETSSMVGIPDIEFSDTSLPIFSTEFEVIGNWNMPVFNFGNASINIIWSWLDEQGTVHSRPPTGSNVVVLAAPGSNTALIHITFNDDTASDYERKGRLRVEVRRRSVVSAIDNETMGPPKLRAFEVEYDTREPFSPDVALDHIRDITPATLRLSEPTTKGKGTWRQDSYIQRFYWSRAVSGFTVDDITIDGRGGTTTIKENSFRKTQEDNRIYECEVMLSGAGTYQITVNAKIAKSGGSEEDNSPPDITTTEWAFDATGQVFSIRGVEVLCTETVNLDSLHPELDNEKGSFLGVSDLHVENGRVYFTSQIQRRRRGKNELSTYEESAGALVSVPISGGACTTLKKYQFFRKSARSIMSHRGEVHLFEGSAYIYDGSAQPNYTLFNVGDGLGVIQRIDRNNVIHEVGLNWRSSFPTGEKDIYDGEHGGTMCPMVSHDDDLHIITERFENSSIDGLQWIAYGKKLNRRITLLQTNGRTGFEVLEELAMLTNSIIGFKNGRFLFEPRLPTTAFLKASITDSATSIDYKMSNREISNSGFAMIGSEMISYTDKTDDNITGVKRGLAGTESASHMQDAKIIFIDRIINSIDLERPVNDMDIDVDGTLLFNNILVKYAENQVPRSDYLSFPAVDRESIMLNGEQEQELILPLNYHQHRWVIDIAEERIKRFRTPQKAINLTLKRDFDISLGEKIYLAEPVLSNTAALCQVMSISQDRANEETQVVLVVLNS